MRNRRRYGSPVSDPLGFLGTALGREVRAEAKKAEKELQSITEDMSLVEANKWLAKNYPTLKWVEVRRDALLIGDKNQKFSNKQKIIVVGGEKIFASN
jgi:hypothetical protein